MYREGASGERVSTASQVQQRDLCHVIGMSLGMTNAILKRLVLKGYLTIRKVNNRNIPYAVTPKGVEAITKRSYRYFKRTIRNIVYYPEAIEAFLHDVKSRGCQGITLAGASDLDFLVEHACEICGIRYLKDDAAIKAATAGSDELFLEKRTRPAAERDRYIDRYTAIIEREDDGYIALCRELDIASHRNTVQEARVNSREAIELFFEHADQNEVRRRLRSEISVTPVRAGREDGR